LHRHPAGPRNAQVATLRELADEMKVQRDGLKEARDIWRFLASGSNLLPKCGADCLGSGGCPDLNAANKRNRLTAACVPAKME
jgi:hypothetical protein